MTLIDPDEYKNSPEGDSNYSAIKLKTPKRVLHFCDGVLEEYSDDEVDCTPSQTVAAVDTGSLSWIPWTRYKLWSAGSTTFGYMETMGEYLAAFFGITTPKYYFELEEYKKRQAEEQQSQKLGWSKPGGNDIEFHNINVSQPTPASVV
ncbi:protein FAM177B [Coccinella septempunctata]|uniref:protein FAM177B n=1 Tax=Coccinella septempunctata TaxID=41139 RepID=UPI001D079A8A|nr:protein FAM177B [Coccinella septempunctata]